MRSRLFAVLTLALFLLWPPAGARAAQSAVPEGEADAGAAQEARDAAPPEANDLDAFIASVMEEWKVPGLAIAVVDEGEVVLSRGYGFRDVENEKPVTPGTLFAIGSITKSFTVSLLGMLVDEGKLDWDEPVREYLPDFRLYDEFATERMTPRDLVTHRSGLPRHDALWYGADFSRREMYDRLRYLEPSEDFRYVFQYQNLMFMTAGYLAGQLAGTTWEDLARRRLLDPLGMARSNFSVEDLKTIEDAALPYVKANDELRKVPYRNIDEVGPAGSINSSVEEMIRYVQLHIQKGKHDGEQLLSEANALEMQTPQITIPGSIEYDELGHDSYGLGLGVGYYRGHKVVSHGGGIDGFISLLSFMPREGIGMIILTNMSGQNPVPQLVSRRVYDDRLGLEPIDWAERVRERMAEAEEAEAEEGEEDDRIADAPASHPLADYAGDYEHPGYGLVRIEANDSTLRASFHGESTELRHYHYDVFEAPDDPLNPVLDEMKVQFSSDKAGRIVTLSAPLEPSVDDIVFQRVAGEELRSSAYLRPFAGEYELRGTTILVELRGEATLTLTVPGQPTYRLVPTEPLAFDFEKLNGYSVEFREEDGEVIEMVIRQPNGTFVAKRT